MKKKVILVSGLLVLLAVAYFATYGVRTTRLETLRQLVAENVPIGSSPDDVTKFLDEQQLDYAPMRRTSDYSNLRKYGDMKVIGAIKRRTWRSLLMYESIRVAFIFDETNHLRTVDFDPIYTGL